MGISDNFSIFAGEYMDNMVLLSFDTEEFDVPKEYGVDISLEEGLEVSKEGINKVLDLLKEHHAKATFFCTVNFVEHAPKEMQRIIDEGHEVASHGVDHLQPKEGDVALSKQMIEKAIGDEVFGYRQPHMFSVKSEAIEQAGYRYNSSLHPTFIPGRYMHLNIPRTPFYQGKVLEIPASVTPWVRLPVFWLACHHYPMWLYKKLCLWTLRHDGQFVVYFHPWEFVELGEHPEWKIPYTIRHNSGEAMMNRLEELILTFKAKRAAFVTFKEFLSAYEQKHHTPAS